MPRFTPDLPVLSDARGEFVRAPIANKPDTFAEIDLADWLSLWAGRCRLTLALKPHATGREYVSLGVKRPDGNWGPVSVARLILGLTDPDVLAIYRNGDTRCLRRHNLQTVREGDVRATRRVGHLFGDVADDD